MITSAPFDVTTSVLAPTAHRSPLEYCVSNHFTSLWCAPDASVLLSSGTDNVMRLYDSAPALNLSLCVNVTDTAYDADWFPYMSSADPSTSAFITTARSLPLQLWDAYTGALRATYVARDHNDEHVSALSVQFSADGYHIIGGYTSALRIFDATRSTDDHVVVNGVYGIVSTIDVHKMSDTVICGTYSGYVAAVDPRSSLCTLTTKGQRNGVTCVRFVNDQHIVVGGRRSDELLCFDLRDVSAPLLRLKRQCATQQKLQIDTALNSMILCGTTDGHIIIYDVNAATDETMTAHQVAAIRVSSESVNGVAFDPHSTTRQRALVAITSGQRRFQSPAIKQANVTKNDEMIDEKTVATIGSRSTMSSDNEDDSDNDGDEKQENEKVAVSDSRIAIWSIELPQQQQQLG